MRNTPDNGQKTTILGPDRRAMKSCVYLTPSTKQGQCASVQSIKVLRGLDGAFTENIRVWDPFADAPADRTTIVDPLTGAVRPVRGLSLSQVSGVAAGGAALLLPNQASMMTHLRTIPDTVDDFTGYSTGSTSGRGLSPG